MYKGSPNQRSVKMESVATPQQKVYAVPADYLDIREDDSQGTKKLKNLPISISPTQLANLPGI